MSLPSAVTTSRLITFSAVVPYISVESPLPRVDAIPPSEGLEAGSGPYKLYTHEF
jgi:hypothetical protein